MTLAYATTSPPVGIEYLAWVVIAICLLICATAAFAFYVKWSSGKELQDLTEKVNDLEQKLKALPQQPEIQENSVPKVEVQPDPRVDRLDSALDELASEFEQQKSALQLQGELFRKLKEDLLYAGSLLLEGRTARSPKHDQTTQALIGWRDRNEKALQDLMDGSLSFDVLQISREALRRVARQMYEALRESSVTEPSPAASQDWQSSDQPFTALIFELLSDDRTSKRAEQPDNNLQNLAKELLSALVTLRADISLNRIEALRRTADDLCASLMKLMSAWQCEFYDVPLYTTRFDDRLHEFENALPFPGYAAEMVIAVTRLGRRYPGAPDEKPRVIVAAAASR